jgi:hypothetical protein
VLTLGATSEQQAQQTEKNVSMGARVAVDGNGSFSHQQFVSGVLWELSVALFHWNARIEWTFAVYFVLAAGGAFMPGVERSMVEVGAEVAGGA